jgi:SAM-dependent methyltransferase
LLLEHDVRPLQTCEWTAKPCDVCGTAAHELLGERAYIWPTRNNRFKMHFRDVRCTNCGFVYAGNVPPTAFLTKYYGDAFSFAIAGEQAEVKPNYDAAKRLKTIEQFVPKGSKILEIGANKGEFCQLLCEHGYDAVGIDPIDKRDDAVVQGGFVTDGKLAEEPVDAIVSYYVLEHIADARTWVRSAFDALRDGGVIIIEVPNFETHPLEALNHEHLLDFTPYHLCRLLSEANFAVRNVDTKNASRYFGFAVVATKDAAAKAPELAIPDTRQIYARAAIEREKLEQRNRRIAAEVQKMASVHADTNVIFWGANEISAHLADTLKQQWDNVAPWIVDNSPEKQGLAHEGFQRPIQLPSPQAFAESATVFLLCSPSHNNQIRAQIQAWNLSRCAIIDVNEF